MKTFESCNRVWLTMPEDGEMPQLSDTQNCRELIDLEQDGQIGFQDFFYPAPMVGWNDYENRGWYPVHADGTDDHETAAKFITETAITPRPPHPRVIRRRFKLQVGNRPTWR